MFKGKTVIITGGSRGIGRAIALAFARKGANIALNYRGNTAAAEEARALIEKENVRCGLYRCDAADFGETKKMTEAILRDFGRADILINNAGATKDGLVPMLSEADFDTIVGANLKSAFNMIRHLYPCFMRNRSGSIVNIGSTSGLSGNAGQANYAAAKAGLIGLTKSVAKELAGRGVTCNAVAPGFIETDMTAVLPEETRQKYLAAVPAKRAGSPEEVAALTVFLAGAGYITGEVIRIDGGLCM